MIHSADIIQLIHHVIVLLNLQEEMFNTILIYAEIGH